MTAAEFERRYKDGVDPAQGDYPRLGYRRTVENGLIIERDVAVPMRDNVNIFVDLFRPDGDRPVAPLIAWSAYGKHSPQKMENFPVDTGVPAGKLSDYTAFEAPDPTYWCPAGYAVIFVDPRGTWGSEGVAESLCGIEEADDCHDLIEWAGTQPWSNGKVGMAGASYLAVMQWLTAATRPPHLAAINPWEGFSDFYRDVAFHGGIPETQFLPWWQQGVLFSKSKVEDTIAMRDQHPLFDAYWETKRGNWANIHVPAYVVASWSDHGLHTRGTIEAYKALGSEHKWLDIHGRKKWGYFYDDQSIARQRAFFDHFLLNKETDVTAWPPVRLEVRDRYYVGEIRSEQSWPLPDIDFKSLYLDASTRTLTTTPVATAARASYDSQDEADNLVFGHTFETDTELIGNIKLKLWVEAEGSDDMDLFVALQKFDSNGTPVHFPFFSIWENGNVALGWLRVSHRELDEERSRPEQPWLLHRREKKLTPGEVVPVEIEVLPSGTLFHAGEKLQLVIQGIDINKYPAGTPTQRHHSDRNRGLHIVYAGGRYDSHLLIPFRLNPRRGSGVAEGAVDGAKSNQTLDG
ncbi:CocE/NonD family hydrolase [Nocardia sp. CA-120079]|uniref:CocE/NonD family hydrolase n=1 Tax=Nocardia sp. CA-120079 TaxID=3239974 RepID=UPI003D99BDC1